MVADHASGGRSAGDDGAEEQGTVVRSDLIDHDEIVIRGFTPEHVELYLSAEVANALGPAVMARKETRLDLEPRQGDGPDGWANVTNQMLMEAHRGNNVRLAVDDLFDVAADAFVTGRYLSDNTGQVERGAHMVAAGDRLRQTAHRAMAFYAAGEVSDGGCPACGSHTAHALGPGDSDPVLAPHQAVLRCDDCGETQPLRDDD